MFYSEIFTVRKYHTNACVPACAAHGQFKKVSPHCSYNLEFAMLILTYFKPKDGLPNHKGPCRCRFHCKQ